MVIAMTTLFGSRILVPRQQRQHDEQGQGRDGVEQPGPDDQERVEHRVSTRQPAERQGEEQPNE
jgi:hypothetical protein